MRGVGRAVRLFDSGRRGPPMQFSRNDQFRAPTARAIPNRHGREGPLFAHCESGASLHLVRTSRFHIWCAPESRWFADLVGERPSRCISRRQFEVGVSVANRA
jgi:hypothetical protein